MVPVTGLEPVRHRWRWILSPLRLPFHHTGKILFKCQRQNRSLETGERFVNGRVCVLRTC